MHPKYKRKIAKAKAAATKSSTKPGVMGDEEKQLQARKFPGLSVPDQEWTPADKYLEDRSRLEPSLEKLPVSLSVDAEFAQIAALARRRPAADDYMGEPSSKRPRGDDRDNGYANRGNPADRGRTRPAVDQRPVLYKIYNGSVTSVKDFGAFVSLEGVQGRVEGLVHVSQLGGGRVNSASEVVNRNQHVKVKVMTIAGTKIGLSMKDVDQSSGADLS
jgi:ATP-dependent RNA helicase DHX8/PRP22